MGSKGQDWYLQRLRLRNATSNSMEETKDSQCVCFKIRIWPWRQGHSKLQRQKSLRPNGQTASEMWHGNKAGKLEVCGSLRWPYSSIRKSARSAHLWGNRMIERGSQAWITMSVLFGSKERQMMWHLACEFGGVRAADLHFWSRNRAPKSAQFAKCKRFQGQDIPSAKKPDQSGRPYPALSWYRFKHFQSPPPVLPLLVQTNAWLWYLPPPDDVTTSAKHSNGPASICTLYFHHFILWNS